MKVLVPFLLLLSPPLMAQPAGSSANALDEPPLLYPEQAQGEHVLWIAPVGYQRWISDRAPLSQATPLAFEIGYAHRIGAARLGWRLQWSQAAPGEEAPLRFISLDLVSIERVYGVPDATARGPKGEPAPVTPPEAGDLRPFWRVALGLALDLKGATTQFGGSGYFNAENGASGGLGLTHAWGLDVFLGASAFLRAEIAGQAHGAAGPTGLSVAGRLGTGVVF